MFVFFNTWQTCNCKKKCVLAGPALQKLLKCDGIKQHECNTTSETYTIKTICDILRPTYADDAFSPAGSPKATDGLVTTPTCPCRGREGRGGGPGILRATLRATLELLQYAPGRIRAADQGEAVPLPRCVRPLTAHEFQKQVRHAFGVL